jgi:hypothetical protein
MSDPGPALAYATMPQLIRELETRLMLAKSQDAPLDVAFRCMRLAADHGSVIMVGYTTGAGEVHLRMHGNSLSCAGMLHMINRLFDEQERGDVQARGSD